MTINKTYSTKTYLSLLLQTFFDRVLVTIVDTFFNTLSEAFIVSLHIITELSIILSKYLPFLQMQETGFQIICFLDTQCSFEFLRLHQHLP